MDHTSRLGPIKAGPTLTSDVAGHLTQLIVGGEFAPGERLPPEHVLASAMNVSRSALREAVAALKADGLLVSRRGAGVFVPKDGARRPFRINAADLDLVQNAIDSLELRAAVEIESAGLAAMRRTTAQAEAIRKALEDIDAAMDSGSHGIEADFAFHTAIAAATNNSYFGEFLEFMGKLLIPRRRIRIDADPEIGSRAYLQMLQREHRAIEQAIRARDAVAAREAMRAHLVDSANRYRAWAKEAGSPASRTSAVRKLVKTDN